MNELDLTILEVSEVISDPGCTVMGDPSVRCARFASLDHATEKDLSFYRSGRTVDPAVLDAPAALVVDRPLDGRSGPQIVVGDVDMAVHAILHHLASRLAPPMTGVSPGASVDPTSELGEGVVVGHGAFIGPRCRIGPRSVIGPNAVLYEDVVLGADCYVGSGSVIGEPGYRYVYRGGKHRRMPHIGGVVIDDDVHIGALATVDAGMIEPTRIEEGVRIGDLAHIAHNGHVGTNALVLPLGGIAGSVVVGSHAVLAGRAGVIDGVSIGDGAQVGAGSMVWSDVPPGAKVMGNPARPRFEFLRITAMLPELVKGARSKKSRDA